MVKVLICIIVKLRKCSVVLNRACWEKICKLCCLLPSSTEKVVGTATPKEPPEQWKAAWKFSTGDELMIQWESSTSISGLRFSLTNQVSESTVGRGIDSFFLITRAGFHII